MVASKTTAKRKTVKTKTVTLMTQEQAAQMLGVGRLTVGLIVKFGCLQVFRMDSGLPGYHPDQVKALKMVREMDLGQAEMARTSPSNSTA